MCGSEQGSVSSFALSSDSDFEDGRRGDKFTFIKCIIKSQLKLIDHSCESIPMEIIEKCAENGIFPRKLVR